MDEDLLLVLLALLVLAIPVSIIVLLVGQSRLKARLAVVEGQLASLSSPAVSPLSVNDPAPASQTPASQTPASQTEASQTLAPAPPAPMGEVNPWAPRATPPVSPPEPAAPQAPDGPIVLRPERVAALGQWLQRNWIYVVSAASMALAGVFLVQYSMQNGLLPPIARVIASYLLGGALIAGGEYVRRRQGDDEGSDTAYLPSVFAGAGVVTLFAATVAARQLYDLIGPTMAFGLHMGTAALAVGLGWIYGPLLVAVGLIGAFAAPFLVGSGSGPTPLLYGYYALIAATGLAVDAVRRWAWLSVLALGLAYLGGAAMLSYGAGQGPWLAFLLVLPALSILLPPLRLTPDQAGPSVLQSLTARGTSGWPPFPVRLAAGSVLTSSIALMMLREDTALLGLLAFAALALMTLALLFWSERAEGLADLALLPAAAFVLRLVMEAGYWPLASTFMSQSIDQRPPETSGPMTITWLVALAAVISAAFALRALRRNAMPLVNALAAVLVAPVSVAVMEFLWLPARVIGVWSWALHAMVLAAGMVALATRFARDGADHRRMAYATLSALSLIALSLFLLTSATALTLALGVLLVAAAWLDRRFDLAEMGLFTQIAVCVLSYRLLIDPGLDWASYAPLGSVLLAFGGAIGAEVAAYVLLKGKGRVMTSGVLESAAMALTAVLVNVLLARWIAPFISFGRPSGVDMNYLTTLNALPWLVLALTQTYRAQLGPTLRRLRIALAAVAGVMAAAGLAWSAIALNPLSASYEDGIGAMVAGPMILDTLALSYAMPGLMLLLAAWRLRFPRPVQLALLTIGAALMALYAGLEIRRFWQGDWLGRPGVTQYELYSYTVALMLLGAALLYQAIASHSATLRRIGMAVIAVTVAKVFLLDASGLTGLTRVFSFLGLGLSLAGLAWLNRWAGKASAE